MLAKTLIILSLLCLLLATFAQGFLVKTFGPDGPKYVAWGFFVFGIPGVLLHMRGLYRTNRPLFFFNLLTTFD